MGTVIAMVALKAAHVDAFIAKPNPAQPAEVIAVAVPTAAVGPAPCREAAAAWNCPTRTAGQEAAALC